VVPDLSELLERLAASRSALERGVRRRLELERERLGLLHERLRRAPQLDVERRRGKLEALAGRLAALSPRATLERGYAIVRSGNEIVRAATAVAPGDEVAVELARGSLDARVEETHD
jgi:exodeoxyribonuclease VII large subunit